MALCPSHADRTPSLSVTQAEDKILIHCQAGCAPEAVLEKLGLTVKDLFLDPISGPVVPPRVVAEYSYQDEEGKELFQVLRYEPKSFKQRHKNGAGEWAWNLDGVRRVCYHLPDMLRCRPGDVIYWVEGEKDCDALWDKGQVATTSPGGANAFKPEYVKPLAGQRVTVIPDNDSAGLAYARQVVTSLREVKADCHVIIVPNGKDISDWLAAGGDVEQLPTMETETSLLFEIGKPQYQRRDDVISWATLSGTLFKAESTHQERTGVHARISVSHDYQTLSWSLFNIERSEDRTRLANSAHQALPPETGKVYSKEDMRRELDAFCLGLWDYQVGTFTPELLAGDSSPKAVEFLLKPYLLDGGGTILFAPPGRGKSYTALLWAVSVHNGISKFWKVKQVPVLFINLERSRKSISRRLAFINKVLGLPLTQSLPILNARGKSLADVLPTCQKYIRQYGVKLVVLDSISRAGFGDLNENKPVNAIIDALSSLCDSWLALGHTSRQSEDHLFGSIMADAGADIVVQLSSEVSTTNSLGIGFEVTKSNDIAPVGDDVITLEFDGDGLTAIRQATPMEFPELSTRKRGNRGKMLEEVMDFILNQDSADATATETANATGHHRSHVARLFMKSGRFVVTRREKQQVFYGVKDLSE